MLLKDYEQVGHYLNINFIEPAGPGLFAYRGDMVLVEGEVADASGRRKPPSSWVRQAVLLADECKLRFVAAFLDDLAKLEVFIQRYARDFAPDMQAILFVANIPTPLVVREADVAFQLIPLLDGMVWNELLDLAALEKGDLKGQSSGEKVATVAKALATYKSKGEGLSLAEALTRTIEVVLESRGAV
ncbi:MAG: hypothetical protein RBS40_01355 [Rhodocyclaceae bacterium]|jgi:hypothetical protein|nr:hypothetical protein [Rhodocyclaceae bacterium]